MPWPTSRKREVVNLNTPEGYEGTETCESDATHQSGSGQCLRHWKLETPKDTHFQKKLFYIRNFYRDDQLVYDAQGNIEGQPQTGPWSLALVEIQ